MRQKSSIPAIQLQSASARFQWPTNRLRNPSVLSRLPPLEPVSDSRDAGADQDPRTTAWQRLEAVLFLAREPLNSRKLSQYANLADGTEARTLIRHLNEHYDSVGRAFRIEQVAGGFQLMITPSAVWLIASSSVGKLEGSITKEWYRPTVSGDGKC